MAKILVCGGAGFIGYHLVKYLSHIGHKIHVVDNLSRGKLDFDLRALLSKRNIIFIEGDLTKSESYNLLGVDYDYIYNLTALVGVKNVVSSPDRTLYINIFSILNLLEWLKNTNRSLKRLIFTSTSEVYSGVFKFRDLRIPTAEELDLAIEDISSSRASYPISKIVGESACFNYHKKYRIPFVIIRYHNIYGPRMGCDHVIPELLLKAKRAKKYLSVYSPTHTRAFCYIDDAIEATVELAQSGRCSSRVFNVGNSEEIAIGKLARKIIDIVNPSLKIKQLGNQKQSPFRRCPDLARLEDVIGPKSRIPLDEGIKLTWQWYKNT